MMDGYKYALVAQDQIQDIIYEASIPFTVYLLNSDQSVVTHLDVSIHLQLFYEGDVSNECPTDVFEKSSARIQSDGCATFNVVIHDTASNQEKRNYIFFVTSDRAADIMPVYSVVFTCYKYHLVFEYATDDSNPVWYKDENRQDRFLEYAVILVDGNNTIVKNEFFILEANICYENGMLVPQGNILSLNTECNLFIDEGGMTVIRFRINDVSKNHQKQRFCLTVATKPGQAEDHSVLPAVSRPVEVKSKRTKRTADEISESRKDGVSFLGAVGGLNDLRRGVPSSLPSGGQLGQLIQGIGVSYPTLLSTDPVVEPTAKQGKFVDRDEAIDALQNLKKWSLITVEGLQKVQWKVAGYAPSDIDGSSTVNLGAPVYAISNPNQIADKLIAIYRSKISRDLDVLSTFLSSSSSLAISEVSVHTVSHQGSSEDNQDESRVHYIVSRYLQSTATHLGLPAYSTTRQLIGFYIEESVEGYLNAVMKYTPLNATHASPTDIDVASSWIKSASAVDRRAVHSIQDVPGLGAARLDALKLKTFTHYWNCQLVNDNHV